MPKAKQIKPIVWTLKLIATKKEYRDEFIRVFLEALEYNGDVYFGEPNFKDIKARFDAQGFWSGNAYRYKWNEITAEFDVEERRFGN